MRTYPSKWLIILFLSFVTSETLYAQNPVAYNNLVAAVEVEKKSALDTPSSDSTVETFNENKYSYNTDKVLIKTLHTNGLLQNADKRSMKEISTLNYGLNAVRQLQPVTYNWKDEPNTNTQIGLIAQDVRKVIPEVVTGNESVEMLGINYNQIIPVLMNALKEQQKEIEELTQKIKDTKNKINLLRSE